MSNLPLPHGLQIIADSAGIDAALKLAMERGGRRFDIPQKAEGSLLAEIVGIDAARKIVEDHANDRPYIPLAKRHLSIALKAAGHSQEKRATMLKTSRRTIQAWDANAHKPQEPDLFDMAI